jgi:dihydroorotate dehydrogenase
MIYSAIRSLLFRLDPEDAHDFTARQMIALQKIPIVLRAIEAFCRPPASAAVELLGMKFRSRIGIAAGFDKNATMMPFLAALGFGFVEVGTVTLRPQPGNPRPRMFRYPESKAIVNRMGFNNDGADAVAERLARWRRTVPLFVNIGKNRDVPLEGAAEAYARCYEKLERFADAMVINVSSPNTPSLRELQRPEHLEHILDAVNVGLGGAGSAEQGAGSSVGVSPLSALPTPTFVKIAPDIDDGLLGEICDVCVRRASGMICTNTTAHEQGGLSGVPLMQKSTRILARVREHVGAGYPLIGVGGILTSDDVRAKIAAGADLVQLYTGFIYGEARPRM